MIPYPGPSGSLFKKACGTLVREIPVSPIELNFAPQNTLGALSPFQQVSLFSGPNRSRVFWTNMVDSAILISWDQYHPVIMVTVQAIPSFRLTVWDQ